MGLGSWEVQPQLSRIIVEPKSVVLISNDSEELNRAMILTLARAVHVTGAMHIIVKKLFFFCWSRKWSYPTWWRCGLAVAPLGSVSLVILRLVLRCVTVCGRENHHSIRPVTEVTQVDSEFYPSCGMYVCVSIHLSHFLCFLTCLGAGVYCLTLYLVYVHTCIWRVNKPILTDMA